MALYFISDLHLQEDSPSITQGLFSYLQSLPKDAEALYILGDFFEYWVGDDDTHPLVIDVKDKLLNLSKQGLNIYFQHGNRDFLLAQAYADACGMQLLEEEHVIEYAGTSYLLMHGDSLCTSDVEYMAFREQSRNPAWQQQILSMSLEERYALAQHMRQTSQNETQMKAEDITDVTQQAVEETMQRHQIQHLIHGHTHRPHVHEFELNQQPATRTVLGDWSDTHGWHIKCDQHGLKLEEFSYQALAHSI